MDERRMIKSMDASSAARLFGWALAILSVTGGCARMLPAARQTVAEQPKPLPSPTTSGTAPHDGRSQATLSAIEDFLERTAAYGQPALTTYAPPARSADRATVDSAYRVAGVHPEASVGGSVAQPGGQAKTMSHRTEGQPAARANAHLAIESSPPLGKTLGTTAGRQAPNPRIALPSLLSVSVRERTPVPSRQPTTTARATNVPMRIAAAEATRSWDGLLADLEERAARGDLEAGWRLGWARLALRHTDVGRDTRAVMPGENGVLLGALWQLAQSVYDFAADPLSTGERAQNAMEALREALEQRAEPVLSTVALCKQVMTYGVYEELDETAFVAGRAIPAIVYAEIEHLKTERNQDNRYETRLATRLELLTADGDSVWQRHEPDIVDQCRHRRADFFVAQRVDLPPTLPAGDYVLKVQVQDLISGKADESHLPIRIIAPISIANRG